MKRTAIACALASSLLLGGPAAALPDCRRFYQIVPEVRTPGLPENVRRLGDLRLECTVMIEIARKEIPLWGTVLVAGALGTRDWCSFLSEKERSVPSPFHAGAPLISAVLHEGKRSKLLAIENDEFRVGLSDALTGTAAGTPRTAP